MRHLLAVLRMTQTRVTNERLLYNALLQAAHDAGATILGAQKHEFYPQGLTAIIILAESHVSLHTYPEQQLVYLDAFTCGKLAPSAILKAFCKLTGARVKRQKTIRRQ